MLSPSSACKLFSALARFVPRSEAIPIAGGGSFHTVPGVAGSEGRGCYGSHLPAILFWQAHNGQRVATRRSRCPGSIGTIAGLAGVWGIDER
jgi:hypothetical protein